MRSLFIIALLCTLGLSGMAAARSDTLQIQENAPDRYVVVKGDTLWDISGRFLKQPWRWPEIWRLNKDQIKDPHWIYPGDVIVLDRSQNPPRLSVEGRDSTQPRDEGSGGTSGTDAAGRIRLGPEVRSSSINSVIPSIPLRDIRAFTGQPLVVSDQELQQAPAVIGFEGRRTYGSTGDEVFVRGDLPKGVHQFQIFRPGKALRDPDTQEVLGYAADYVGDARLAEETEPARMVLLKGAIEVALGDRLLPPGPPPPANYVPNAPSREVHGHVINVPGSNGMAGRNSVVVISRGSQDGLVPGNVLAVFPAEEVVPVRGAAPVKLPETRSGLLFVFRTFDRVSYALVVQSQRPVNALDYVHNP